MSKKTGKNKETRKKSTTTTPPSSPTIKRKKKGLLYDIDIRELTVLLIAGNFLIDGIIMIILITKLYL